MANSTPPKIFLVRAHPSVHGSVYPTCLSDQTPDTILPLSSVPALGNSPLPHVSKIGRVCVLHFSHPVPVITSIHSATASMYDYERGREWGFSPDSRMADLDLRSTTPIFPTYCPACSKTILYAHVLDNSSECLSSHESFWSELGRGRTNWPLPPSQERAFLLPNRFLLPLGKNFG